MNVPTMCQLGAIIREQHWAKFDRDPGIASSEAYAFSIINKSMAMPKFMVEAVRGGYTAETGFHEWLTQVSKRREK